MTSRRYKYGAWRIGGWRSGLTLIELLVSVAITSVLMVTIASAMLIATKALPDPNRPASQIIAVSHVAEQLAAEIQYAVSISARSSTMIEFTVADRNSDDVPETIRYEWSGVAGEALKRQYNGGSIVDVLDNVHELELTYSLKTTGEEPYQYFVTSVDIKLRAGPNATTQVDGAAQVLNAPEVSSP